MPRRQFASVFQAGPSPDLDAYRAWYSQEFGNYLACGGSPHVARRERRHAMKLAALTGLTITDVRAQVAQEN